MLAVANVTAAPVRHQGVHARPTTASRAPHYTVKDGVPVKTDQGNNEVLNAYVMVASPAATIAHPDFPDGRQGHRSSGSSGGRLHQEVLLLRHADHRADPLHQPLQRLRAAEDDIVRGRKKISDMQQAVSDWKSKGGDKLRDWYQKLLDDNGTAAS